MHGSAVDEDVVYYSAPVSGLPYESELAFFFGDYESELA
jgi:hypothetical protein